MTIPDPATSQSPPSDDDTGVLRDRHPSGSDGAGGGDTAGPGAETSDATGTTGVSDRSETTGDTGAVDGTGTTDSTKATDTSGGSEGSGGRRGRRTWVGRLALLAVFAMVAGCVPFLWVLTSTSDHRHTAASVPERPVALVLGAGVRPDGRPSLLLARRLDAAADLYFAGKVDVVLVTGDNSVEHYNETDTMRAYLVDAGVPGEHIVGDYAGFSTWDSCVRAHEVFGVREATVVTQDFHLPRAVRLCRSAGIDAVGVADSSMEERAFATVYGWFREVPAAVAALGSVVLRPDPMFLGDYESGVDEALALEREPGSADG
ncbi:SanA/YdcF family protein [Nocardiopsis deserti]|uniref:SanA/YdcF family protein n=1 Tax=Nocardiopsis deserti TaxID=2605988 RepID=UPI00167FEDF3|nr:ElyC/SanA/YdcF family protein [Nocardiopsis deserti]